MSIANRRTRGIDSASIQDGLEGIWKTRVRLIEIYQKIKKKNKK